MIITLSQICFRNKLYDLVYKRLIVQIIENVILTHKSLQEYNGGLLLSRHRSDKSLSPESKAELQRVAKKFQLNFDDMCASNNEHCPEN